MGHQGDGFGFMINAVFDSWQRRNDTLVVGDFVWRNLFLWNLFVSIASIEMRIKVH